MSKSKERPRIICHMTTTLDGKVAGDVMGTKAAKAASGEYERTNASYNPDAWLCGRTTTEIHFTHHTEPVLDKNAQKVPSGDFVAKDDAKMYYVSIDRLGKVGWETNEIQYQKRPEAHVIEVLSEKAPNAYKAFLRDLNISYIIAGKKYIHCTLASKKLKGLFGIKTLMLSGGGSINGSFLNEGLVDEISLLMAAATDASPETPSVFDRSNFLDKKPPFEFTLEDLEKLPEGGLWLRYKSKKQ